MRVNTKKTDLETKTIPPKLAGVPRLIAATVNSAAGLKAAFLSEEAFRLEVYAFFLLSPLALWVGNGAAEKILLVFSLMLIILMELVNTAVETVVDLVTQDYSELAAKAKDIGSSLVLISMLFAAAVWATLLF